MLDRLLDGRVDYIVAFVPWNSPYGVELDDYPSEPQEQIDNCLNCPLAAASCELCDGCGHLQGRTGAGRPRRSSDIDMDRFARMVRDEASNREIAAEFGISPRTVVNYKRFMEATI